MTPIPNQMRRKLRRKRIKTAKTVKMAKIVKTKMLATLPREITLLKVRRRPQMPQRRASL
jgi:hypothetical protein